MASNSISLEQQRQYLREQLQAQRLVIAVQLERAELQEEAYPRSFIMRFLTNQSVTKVVAELATVALGARLIKSLSSAWTVAKFVTSVAKQTKGIKV